jgi:hypothetical protein
MTTNPSLRWACDHARTYGSWRSQLMQVSVQGHEDDVTAQLGGAEWLGVSHSVAPPSKGMRTRSNTVI